MKKIRQVRSFIHNLVSASRLFSFRFSEVNEPTLQMKHLYLIIPVHYERILNSLARNSKKCYSPLPPPVSVSVSDSVDIPRGHMTET